MARDLILIPRPAMAPVDSAAIRVVSAVEIPSLTAVMINGVVAGKITFTNSWASLAPNTLAALINVSSTLITPWKIVTVIIRKVARQITIICGVRPTPTPITTNGTYANGGIFLIN